ncbi:hypothetical protein niasHS_002649 [Heterodera schachtii]|uniref:Uncharacterized protein n=1 Tax=Heterodera schachtii TaxID=97005 RepID=A0ABD2K253_HETSC
METERTKSDELLAFVQEEEKHQSDSHRVEVAFMQDSDGVTVGGTKTDRVGAAVRYGKKGRRRVPRRVEDGFEQLLKTRKEREEWLTNGRIGRWESAEEAQGNAEERFKVGLANEK